MPAAKRFLTAIMGAAALVFIASGCGGSASRPTPQGGFTTASVNGTYAFSFSGSDTSGFFAGAGTLTTDGAGHVTAGILDFNSIGTGALPNVSVTGTYSVKADGRGTAILNTNSTTLRNINIVFVVISNQHALIVRFENSATGSGTMDLSNSGAFSTTALAGSFAFNLSGFDGAGNPEATLGSITLDNTGNLVSGTGVQDVVDDTIVLANQPITVATLTIAPSGRGTLAMISSIGTLNFAIYPVSTNFFKAVEIDNVSQLAGDVFRQQGPFNNTVLNGPFAFTLGGADQNALAPLVEGGIFAASGTGVISSGTEDLNDAAFTPSTGIPITGSYSISGLRGTLTFSGTNFSDNFVFYPTTGGIQLMEIDSGVVLSGVAFQQSGTFSNTSLQGTYGVNLTGPGLDFTAAVNANGNGAFNGIFDSNNSGSLAPGAPITGTYTIGASGRGPLSFSSGLGPQSLAVYVVNNTQAVFIEVDPGLPALGQMQHQ